MWCRMGHVHGANMRNRLLHQIAANMQTVTLGLVTPVPQGAHWLIRKQAHSGDQPLLPLQWFGFVGQGLSLEPLPPCREN